MFFSRKTKSHGIYLALGGCLALCLNWIFEKKKLFQIKFFMFLDRFDVLISKINFNK
jgi:hypothetical protein